MKTFALCKLNLHSAKGTGLVHFLINPCLQLLTTAVPGHPQRPQVDGFILTAGFVLFPGQRILGAQNRLNRRRREVQPDIRTVVAARQGGSRNGRSAELDLAVAGADPRADQASIATYLKVDAAAEGDIEITCTPQQLSMINRIGSIESRAESADYGYGLGLELVQQLCERLGYQLHTRIEAQHFCAVILFTSD